MMAGCAREDIRPSKIPYSPPLAKALSGNIASAATPAASGSGGSKAPLSSIDDDDDDDEEKAAGPSDDEKPKGSNPWCTAALVEARMIGRGRGENPWDPRVAAARTRD